MRRVLTYILLTFLLCGIASAQPKGETSAFLDAAAAYAEGDYNQALLRFSALYEADPFDDAVCYYMGVCEFALNDAEAAEKHLSEAVAIDPENEWYLHALSTLYNAKGDQMKAAELLEKLVKKNSSLYGNPYTLTMIGDYNLRSHRDSLALSYYNQALESDPEYAPAEFSKAELLRMQGNYAPFFTSLENLIRNEDVDPTVISDYLKEILSRIDSKFWWVWGDTLASMVDLCAELHPDDIQSHVNRINIFYIRSDWDGVVSECHEVQRLASAQGNTEKLVEAYSIEGDVYHQDGDMKSTYKVYEAALKADPNYAPVLNNYAYYLSLEGRKLKKALEMSRRTIEDNPDNATYLDTYAWILYLLGKPAEAKPYFKHAMLYGGRESDTVLEHYSKVLEALGETDLASYYHSLAEQKKAK